MPPARILLRITGRTDQRSALFVGCALLALLVVHADEKPAEPVPLTPGEPTGVLLRLDADGKLEVVELTAEEVEKSPPRKGLFIWPEGEQAERWEAVAPGWRRPPPPPLLAAPDLVADHTRGGGGTGGVEATQLTVQLEQINPEPTTRAVTLMTPADGGKLLSPKPVFRRLPERKENPLYPAEKIAILSKTGRKTVMTVHFAAGQKEVAFADIVDRPKDGLPPGDYLADAGSFTVVEKKERDKVLLASDQLAALLKGRTDPLYLQFTLERLLKDKDKTYYLSDAIDLLDSVPEKELSEALRVQRANLLRCLEAPKEQQPDALKPKAAPGDATKITEIDNVRDLIAANKWGNAEKVLKSAALKRKAAADPRTAGLADLYRGVILSEAGPNQVDEADAAFQRALEGLKEAEPADRYRAHVNYGNFLLRDAQDRLNNHAMQMAAGVQRPLLSALQTWLAARQQYEAALPLANQVNATAEAAARVNLARLHALLADTIRVLDRPDAGRRAFEEGEQAAAKQADAMAAAAGETKGADRAVKAAAEEIRALVAFRRGEDATATTAAHRALAIHLEDGRLTGAESVHRLLGLIARRSNRPEARQEALKHFQIAHLIAESLRERFPPDQSGMSRAGFFARKAYVSEKIVELLLADGSAAKALHYAELAKARALQDVLAVNAKGQAQDQGRSSLDLTQWPADAAAIEYFLGAEEAYVFVVSPKGNVTAHLLRDDKGKPVVPRELIARVRRLLADMEGHSAKILNGVYAGRGYDNSWQVALHRLYGELLPEAARRELNGAKVLVIVPQHILHYFPFAALVAEMDDKATTKRMARPPRFLIDEGFDLIYAPSLSAWRAIPAAAVAQQVWAVGLADIPGAPALEGVKTDLDNLNKTFGKRVERTLEGAQAREADVKKLLDKPGLLFFGTHGINVADQPLESHLMLHPEEKASERPDADDGRLTAGKLFGRKVTADLVVMSACYSGLGDRSPLPGDDLFGLQRAFLQSGARTVVSGLWDVYDGTAPELMLSFFQNLGKGRSSASALCDSQRAFLNNRRDSVKNEPYVHPYFWAVYTTAGDDRTRVEK